MYPAGSDWNNALDNGFYMDANSANAPVAGVWMYGIVVQHNPSWVTQRLLSFANDYKEYIRHRKNGTWSAWQPNAGAYQAGTFNTGAMSNNTQYGWNVWFPVPFTVAPRAVVCTLMYWSISSGGIWGPWAQNYYPDRFDLYLLNTNNSENVTVQWLAFC
jgi:hypothetical protein